MVLGEHFGSYPAEFLGHTLSEGCVTHRGRAYAAAYPGLVLSQTDPTGLSSTLGQIVIAACLLVSLVFILRHLWNNRGR